MLAACSASTPTTPGIEFDPCTPPTPTVSSATDVQAAGLAAAEALWRGDGVPGLGTTPGAVLEVRFQHAAPEFYGLYDAQAGMIYVNDELTDPGTLSIVIAHELGHAFGLVHISASVRASVMNPGNLLIQPTTDDRRTLENLWGSCE
jgi:hypothetical protein